MSIVKWLNRRVVPLITALGIAPRSLTLEVRGRKSGNPIRLSLSPARLHGKRYPVSLAGEQEWLKNIRAAHGAVFILHGRRLPIHLSEVPAEQRGPILLAYVRERAFTRSAKRAAHLYFGLEAPTLEDMERLAPKYPVFLMEEHASHRH